MKNKKGLSGIVTTLIIILLVLVAAGVIATVVNNFLGKTSGSSEKGMKCLDIDVRAVKVAFDPAVSNTTYNVTLKRSALGDEEELGAKIVFFSDNDNSAPVDFGSMLTKLQTSTNEFTGALANANRIEVTPYFVDDAGKDQLCQSTSKFEFQ